MDTTKTGCWFCDDRVRETPPPGGWLYQDEHWRVGHSPAAYAPAGTVIVESRRHVRDQAAMNAAERAGLAETVGRAVRAIETVTGCDRVYQWASMDRWPHFHQWLLPWRQSAPTRGPRYLAASLVDGAGCAEQQAEHTAASLRAAWSEQEALR